jgi:hypothetical protein
MRTAFVLAGTLLAALSAAQEPVDPKPEAPATAAERMEELEELLQKAIDDWQEASKKAKEEAKDGQPVDAASTRPDFGPILAKADAYAAEFAGKDDAVQFLWFIVQNGAEKDTRRGALDTLLTTHIESPELSVLGRALPYIGQIVDEEFAETAVARALESGNANLRGWALLAKHKGDIEEADRGGEQYALAKKTLLAAAEASDDKRLAKEIRSAIDLREKFGAGNVAPDIAGIDLDGVEFKLSDYKGKVVFLDFWGDW